ncbi:hypothetical protein [Natrarchaeobaculum sulfurireducens]|uniref:Uncharacterized protein n=1 Tax=Natrarchaeobaculum sulfurireducens TaxID=2044521 RepID=A0A346PPN6_9EURY|nr:hypothetical protein [Natrarchaeobaculum sulfurireducens]AXR81481.1 hypothetical protein AArcMg_1468 [Natrarchaeobaculum sulfurireducens]
MSQPEDTRDRVDAGDEAVVEPFGHPVTINELHAMILGFSGLVIGYTLPVLGPLLILYAILGKPRFHSMAHDHPDYRMAIGYKSIRHEPWYFLFTYICTFMIGVLV